MAWAKSPPKSSPLSGFQSTGLVDSMASPSGSVTGFSAFEPSMAGKWLQLFKEIAPNVERATFMFNPVTAPFNGGPDLLQVAEAAALSVGVNCDWV